ncbi:MAG: hypothetical protein J7K11_02745 [Candidatus Hydrothermae bacterium]|nr:hypothetical protein [Candidatus Hydrothermae bacterium]
MYSVADVPLAGFLFVELIEFVLCVGDVNPLFSLNVLSRMRREIVNPGKRNCSFPSRNIELDDMEPAFSISKSLSVRTKSDS